MPRHALDWPLDRVRVVLCHEIAHIRRYDWAVQMAAETVRATLWFHPLVWVTCTRLRREAEQACDDEVIASGVEPHAYAADLISLARQFRRPGSTWASATPMAHPSTLERRIAAMLNPRLDRQRPSGRATTAIAIVLMLVTVPAAVVRARQAARTSSAVEGSKGAGDVAPSEVVTPTVKKPIVASVTAVKSSPRASAPRIATAVRVSKDGSAVLSGTIYDATGAVVPGVQVTLVDANQIA